MSFKCPKPWKLTTNETITSYETWKQNQLYNLVQDAKFAKFLDKDVTWEKQTSANPYRGLEDDTTGDKQTRVQKSTTLDMLLGQIASFCPVLARNIIVKKSTSLESVWQKIREHYGFLSTGSHFLELSNFKLEVDEKPEDLYQRLYAFYEDNLVTKSCGLTHNGEKVTVDEDLTPTIENTITWYWLQLVHPGLPNLVKTKYGPELRNKTLSSIKTEISQAMSSLLEELDTKEDARIFRSMPFQPSRSKSYGKRFSAAKHSSGAQSDGISCELCKTARRPYSHYLSQCKFLPEADKKYFARARVILEAEEEPSGDEGDNDYDQDKHQQHNDPYLDGVKSSARRVTSEASPVLDCIYNDMVVHVTNDTGATTNMIRESAARRYKLHITRATQLAGQADGVTPLSVVGEVHIQLYRGSNIFQFDALVVKQLDVDVLGGMPFMSKNDIGVRPAKKIIIIKGKEIVPYASASSFNNQDMYSHKARLTHSFVLRGPNARTVVLPGEAIVLRTPDTVEPDNIWTIEPRSDSKSSSWIIPQEIKSVDNTIHLHNTTEDPILIDKNAHICQVRSVVSIPNHDNATNSHDSPNISRSMNSTVGHCETLFSNSIEVDPDNIVSQEIKSKFQQTNLMYDRVFNPNIPKYNGKSGDIFGNVNMGQVLPPQRKARMPHYNHEQLVTLQNKFDELESGGVFVKPESVGVVAEYLNMSFLTPKSNGGHRLVTSFGEVGLYSKPQPSIMPNVDDTLRCLGKWKYIVKTDLNQAFYQIPLTRSSMKYCGVATPFKGVRVYARCAMGMPGSETALEELMNRVVGHLIQEGVVTKIADDLYCGGNTPEEVLHSWCRLLKALDENNLGLSARKTIILPKTTVVLGWVWSEGTLKASPHKIAALTAVDVPKKVRALRSYIGAYKVLSRVLKQYAEILYPLEQLQAGRDSSDDIQWSDTMLAAFKRSQEALSNNKTIHIPRPEDVLWIVSDGAVTCGIAATLYLIRDGKQVLGGFFNSQLRKTQTMWLPCEVEALGISSAISHFAPYIIQSNHQARVLTDNKPCVQAVKKMQRGQFSNSARVTTFLTNVFRYNIIVSHIHGINIPLTDFASRNPVECSDHSCQICKFVEETAENVVRTVSVQDVVKGHVPMPYISRSGWLNTQKECSELRKVYQYLSQGNRPSKKMTKIPNIKRFLQRVVIARDGLLVVVENRPFQRTTERIVVPCNIAYGLFAALHIIFIHPTAFQLKRVASRYYYALNMDSIIEEISHECPQCNALSSIPEGMCEQSSVEPPSHVGSSYAADIIKRNKQLILILRETVTSYTTSMFISDEGHKSIRDAIITLAAAVKNIGVIIRVDPGPGLVALVGDDSFKSHGIEIDVGRIKNRNKNPVAERAISELEGELSRICPDGGSVSVMTLALATAALNSRVRRDGLSSRELWTQRDQLTGVQLPVEDQILIDNQQKSRHINHLHSAKSKARGRPPNKKSEVQIGSLVYIKCDKDKHKARDKYLITDMSDNGWCKVQKFVKSQYRAKSYDVKLEEIFPVLGDKSSLNTATRDRQPRESSDSDDNENMTNPVEHRNNVTEVESSESETDQDAVDIPRRSGRERHPPVWYPANS